jgi:type VI secretion system secreted protein Hcp
MRSQPVSSRSRTRLALAVALGVAVLGVMPSVADADRAFLRLDGIAGESNAQGFENQIDVSAFSWGLSNPTTPGGAGGARPAFQDLTVTKAVDAASPPLFAAVASGQHVANAVLTVVTAGEQPEQYLRYCLQDLTVSSLQQDGGGGGHPGETVAFSYGRFAIAYGAASASGTRTFVTQGWDLINNLRTTEAC